MKKSKCTGNYLYNQGFKPLYKYGPEKTDLWFIAELIRDPRTKVTLEDDQHGSIQCLNIDGRTYAIRKKTEPHGGVKEYKYEGNEEFIIYNDGFTVCNKVA